MVGKTTSAIGMKLLYARHQYRRASETINTRGGTERLRSEMKRTESEQDAR